MTEMKQIWVPDSTPMGTKPLMCLITQPTESGWKLITVSIQQFNEWTSDNSKNKQILFG